MKFLILFLISFSAMANVKVYFQDAKFPSQKMVEKFSVSNPVSDPTYIYTSAVISGPTSAAATTISTGLTDPDVPRNLVITPSGTTANVGTCNLVVTGKSIHGASITETFAFTTSQATSITGNSAFKEVDSLTFPANCESTPFGAFWAVGLGDKIGLPRCLDNAGDVFHSLLNGSKEATGPTMAVDNDEVQKNTANFDGVYNSTNDFDLYYMQNYRCKP